MTPHRRRRPALPFTSAPPDLRETWAERLRSVAAAVGRPSALPPGRRTSPGDLVRALELTVDVSDRSQVWLALATLSATLPDADTVVSAARACELDGGRALWDAVADATTPGTARRDVRIVTGQTLVDVNHTVATDLATGIQRVARETVRRWLGTQRCLPVAWTDRFEALRSLTALEAARLRPGAAVGPSSPGHPEVLVPWRSSLIVPELAAEHDRSRRLLALARYSGNRTGVIGFDCVPLTSAETTAEGFAAVFFGNLAAVRHFDRLAAISDAAAQEYDGWRTMLGAVGLPGPQIRAITLPEEAPEPTTDDLERARKRFLLGDLPFVLVVGSHEPRKNHLAVLHAAELRWRRGDRFSLTFVGGNSWASEDFHRGLAELQRAGRPIDSASRLPDGMLWAAYRLARFTVFPSLNEGFGLPVAESLAAGTPVVTSQHGSMREIGARGGALLVDPRDEHEIAAAMGRLLSDDTLLASLTQLARARSRRSWEDYAREVWDFLVAEPLPA